MSLENQTSNRVISDPELEPLNARQCEVYSAKLTRFSDYLREKGKDPKKNIGYQRVTERISRIHRMMKWIWQIDGVTTEFTTEHANTVTDALADDLFRRVDGTRYSEAASGSSTTSSETGLSSSESIGMIT
jgi:hypothetical protein